MEYKLRLYGFVPYQLSDIQKGIQFGHAVVEYGLEYSNHKLYQDWANNYKTFIILNGGTTSTTPNYIGSLNLIVRDLLDNNINYASFYEPDLGDQLTAVVFLADDRVWDKETYPDFKEEFDEFDNKIKYREWKNKFSDNWDEQNKIIFLRKLLENKRLA